MSHAPSEKHVNKAPAAVAVMSCPRCGMQSEKTHEFTQYRETYENFHCYECKKPFQVMCKTHATKTKRTPTAPAEFIIHGKEVKPGARFYCLGGADYVRVMAVVEGYVMARVKGGTPIVRDLAGFQTYIATLYNCAK